MDFNQFNIKTLLKDKVIYKSDQYEINIDRIRKIETELFRIITQIGSKLVDRSDVSEVNEIRIMLHGMLKELESKLILINQEAFDKFFDKLKDK